MKKTIIFDAYGTLIDLNAVTDQFSNKLGSLTKDFNDLWRKKQLEYAWLISQQDPTFYLNFWDLTKRALDYTFEFFNIKDSHLRQEMLLSYQIAPLFPDTLKVLQKLTAENKKIVILTNATPEMLTPILQKTGIDQFISNIFSADTVKKYKPTASVYGLIAAKEEARNYTFVSSNAWDIYGATSYGFNTTWINRTRAPFENLPFAPVTEVDSLEQLLR
ncbi:haloacid dehalogenase type II [Liquorilactobacillus satsumensis]|uniref:haloacid dehalogenase type II n=1 Tax=Liquorilactobacillus satsumensis TaxID=259059 RepID=UPI001E528637|nr:haloacid dehalogenase type II [Liquorilactobacillus satsumensis]MCC7666296.1 haloacid dehalogenase type II [Liquorilactobacillus satsumensis]MCP9312777.1 haloacid dehalogenase type II [Liquorilactobacillus satsumensis]MCP9358401.1 haloacid dehalogenase type II [Liquorilactobacillus satsumensis]MCP9359209.1 haloacid dehalogenase type II [Liquorilactobacillus satsumensis]MCP9372355.1 haloacid dehalogenase type II [Liquorilactobacillus satsumensis]